MKSGEDISHLVDSLTREDIREMFLQVDSIVPEVSKSLLHERDVYIEMQCYFFRELTSPAL